MTHSQHLVLTTIVKDAQWRADAAAAMASAHQRLHERAQQRGLLIHGQPIEDVEVLYDAHRVRITLTAEAVAADGAADVATDGDAPASS